MTRDELIEAVAGALVVDSVSNKLIGEALAAIDATHNAEATAMGYLSMRENCKRHYDENNRLADECKMLAALLREAGEVLDRLLRRDEINTCQHDETHRGGVLWEICDSCGAKWAEDEGGKPEWKDPQEWIDARDIISKIKIEMKNHDDGQAKN